MSGYEDNEFDFWFAMMWTIVILLLCLGTLACVGVTLWWVAWAVFS